MSDPALTAKVRQGVIRDLAELDGALDQILTAFEQRHSQTTKVRLLTILDDYSAARAGLPRLPDQAETPFRPFVFRELFSKLKAVGWWASSLPAADFQRLSHYFFQEIERRDPTAAGSFRWLLGADHLATTPREALKLLNNFLAPYVEILVNTHQYTRTTVANNRQIAHSYLADFQHSWADARTLQATVDARDFLDQIVADYGQGTATGSPASGGQK